jgi:outer membrane immunogenic protein
MKKLLVAGIATAAFLATPALAGPPPPPMFNWSGFYVGAEGGAVRGNTKIEGFFGGGPIVTPTLHDSGGIFGGTAGYNWQSGLFVFGIEGDASWTNINPQGHDDLVFPTCTAGGIGTCGAKLDFLGTVRGRAGIVVANNFLVYATGGGAFGDIKAMITNPGSGTSSGSNTNSGSVWGGGLEAMLWQNWSAKIEYLHVDLGNGKIFSYGGGGDTAHFKDWNANIVRFGLNYKFF